MGTAAIATGAEPTYFPLDACVCEAIPQLFRRGTGLAPKKDVWTLLGLWSLADSLPKESRCVIDIDGECYRGARIRFPPSRLLEEMDAARRRLRPGSSRADFAANAWRDVRESVRRLARAPVEFQYSRKVDSRIVIRRFEGTLIAADFPVRGGPAGKRQPWVVTLNAYDGVETGFFAFVNRFVFEIREHLDEMDTRLLVWLIRQHRGRKAWVDSGRRKKRLFVHNWEVEVDLGVLGAQMRLHVGQRARRVDRLRRSLARLKRLGILRAIEDLGHDVVRADLSEAFFHEEGD